MFGIGTTEVLIILVVALLVIGPTKLPEVAKSLGKGMAEFKRMSSDVKRTIDWETQFEEDVKSGDTSRGAKDFNREKDAQVPDAEDAVWERPLEEGNVASQVPQEEIPDSEDKETVSSATSFSDQGAKRG